MYEIPVIMYWHQVANLNADKLKINELFAVIKAAIQKPIVIMGDFNYS